MVQSTQIDGKVCHTQDKYFTSRSRYLWQIFGGGHCGNIYYADFHTWRERITSVANFFPIPQFARYPRKLDSVNGEVINIYHVINEMTGPVLKQATDSIMAAAGRGDAHEKDRLKGLQPYITHAGINIPRRNDGLIQPSFTYQLDIDYKSNKGIDIAEALDRIIKDKQLIVLLASKSMSGNGIKALLFLKDLLYIRDEWTHEEYKSVYHQVTDLLYKYFLDKHRLAIDTQMKSISQPFYLFHSSNLYINKGLR